MSTAVSLPLSAAELSVSPPSSILFAIAIAVLLPLGTALAVSLFLVARDLHSRRLERAEEAIWSRLAPYLSGREGLVMAAVELLDEFPERAVAHVLRRSRREFGGEAIDGASVALAMIGETSRLRRRIDSVFRGRRLAAAQCLGDCGGPQAIEGLASLLAHGCPDTRRVARLGLLQCGDASSFRRALGSYVAEEPAPRRVEGGFVRQLVRRAPDLIVDELQSGQLPSPYRRQLLDGLAEIGWQGAASVLEGQLQSRDPEVRAAAVRLATSLRDWRSRGRMIELLEDETWFVRAAAASALGRLPSRDAVEPLFGVLSDRRLWVRRNAATGLVRHGEAGIGALVRALREPGRAGEAAQRALFEVGFGTPSGQEREAS